MTLNGKPFDGIRILPWGGRIDEGEQMFIVTNYPADVLDIIEVPYRIDPIGHPTGCGIWIFLADVDGDRIETLSPGGRRICFGMASSKELCAYPTRFKPTASIYLANKL